jgi:hypothetical protein
MAHDVDSTAVAAITAPTAQSAAAERMRRHRERRRNGMRCLMVELRETEIDALIRRGLLQPEIRNNRNAVCKAFYTFLDLTLGATP